MLRKQRLECNESIEFPRSSFITDGHSTPGKDLDHVFPCVYTRHLRAELVCSRDTESICSVLCFVML